MATASPHQDQLQLEPLVAPDHLSRCPAEILGYIFKLVGELSGDKQMVGAISRSLLPYTRANILRSTPVKSLAALSSLIEAGSHLGEYIETLIIHLIAPPVPTTEFYPDTVDEPSPSRLQLVHFLDTLARVRTLVNKGSTRLAEVVLSMDVAYRGLPSLEVLFLGAEFSSWSNPFDPAHYNNLMYYSRLEQFELHIQRAMDSISDADTATSSSDNLAPEPVPADAASASDHENARATAAGRAIAGADVQEATIDDASASEDDEEARSEAEEGADDVTKECDDEKGEDDEGEWDDFDSEDDYSTDSEYEFSCIMSFILVAPLGHPNAPQIVEVAPMPICLSLGSTSPSNSFATFLERLESPDCLYLLELYNHSNNMVGHATPVDDVLLKFSRLDNLTLSAGTFGPRLFTHTLPFLPLEHLTFELYSNVSKSQLLALVEGPNRLATLKRLTLNNVVAERGTRILEDADGVLCEETDDGMYPDWMLGNWTPSFPREGVTPLVQAAERAGVVVDGSVLRALEVEDEFDDDADYVGGMMAEFADLDRW